MLNRSSFPRSDKYFISYYNIGLVYNARLPDTLHIQNYVLSDKQTV